MVAAGRVLGLVLLFVGTLVEVAFASTPGSCFTSPPTCSGFGTQAANAVIAAKLLFSLGLFCLAGASGIRLQGGMMPRNTQASGEETEAKPPHVWANLLVLLVSILLMALILLTVNGSPLIPVP